MILKDLYRITSPTVIGKLLRFPLNLLPKKMVVSVLSGVLRGKKWIIGAGVHACWIGIYEHEKQKVFADALHAGHVIYDVGANVGFYTLVSAASAGAGGESFCLRAFKG